MDKLSSKETYDFVLPYLDSEVKQMYDIKDSPEMKPIASKEIKKSKKSKVSKVKYGGGLGDYLSRKLANFASKS